MTIELDKRHELQRLFLREGYPQDEAREMAADLPADRLDEWLEKWREHAMQFPERAIVPPGTVDLEDVKSQREQVRFDAEVAEYFEKQDRLSALMAQSFSVAELPLAVLQALLDVLEAGGRRRLPAMADIIRIVESLRKHERVKEEQR